MAQAHSVDQIINQIGRVSPDEPTIVTALKDLGVDDKKAGKSVTTHLSRLSTAKRNWDEGKFQLGDAVTTSDAVRVGEMIDKWRDFRQQRLAIFGPRIQFERIVNELFVGKQLYFDDRNVPKVRLESGEEIDIHALFVWRKTAVYFVGGDPPPRRSAGCFYFG